MRELHLLENILHKYLTIIGRVDGQCIFIRRQEIPHDQSETLLHLQTKCVVLDLLSGRVSHLVTLKQIMEVCPFKIVTSENEAEVLLELIKEWMPKGIIGKVENILSERNS